MRSLKRCLISTILLAGLGLGSVGCSTESFLAGLSLGWLLGSQDLLATSEYTCYRDGQLIDCSAVPIDLMPGN
jgi:hypothetical protein